MEFPIPPSFSSNFFTLFLPKRTLNLLIYKRLFFSIVEVCNSKREKEQNTSNSYRIYEIHSNKRKKSQFPFASHSSSLITSVLLSQFDFELLFRPLVRYLVRVYVEGFISLLVPSLFAAHQEVNGSNIFYFVWFPADGQV